MILVTGATGTIGSEVLRLLKNKGVEARALVRTIRRASAIRGLEFEIYEGDLDRPETLTNAFDGVERLFLSSPAHPDQVRRETNAVKVAKKAGVKHIVKLSAMGANPDSRLLIGKVHGEIERIIEHSGIPYTHLRPHLFMQSLFMYAEPIRFSGAIYAPMKDGKIGMVHARDIAAVAVAALTEAGHENKVYEITGPEAVSFADVAERLSRITGEDIDFVNIPPSAARAGMIQSGVQEWMADALLELYAVWAAGQASRITDTVTEVTGRWPIPLDKFLGENKDAFS